MQLERRLAVEHPLAAHRCEFALENGHTVFDGGKEPLLLLPQHVGDARLLRDEFGIGRPHLGDKIGHQAVEEGCARAELVAMADGAANDATQDVTAPFVARNHAVGDQERAGADVIGEHAQ